MHLKPPKVIGLILAGGQGTRMQGQDKGLIEWQSKPLVAHVLERLAPQVDRLYISANRNLAEYAGFAATVITDELAPADPSEYKGPMAGISSLINHLDSTQGFAQKNSETYLLVVPCDTPKLPLNLVERLLNDCKRHSNSSAAVVHDGERQQNLHCLIKSSAWQNLNEFHADGGLALRDWFTQQEIVHSDFSDCPEAFKNMNRLQDLK